MSSMLTIERKLVKIKKVSPVDEFKGDKRDYACSVRIEWVSPNTILDLFDKDVRKAFYERDTGKSGENAEGQGELSLPRADVELTKRKMAYVLTPIAFKKEYEGYTIVFHRGSSEASDIRLGDVSLDSFTADPHDGGSCLMSCKAYMKPPAEQRGYIDHMSQTEIEITLTPPTAKQTEIPVGKSKAPKKGAADFEDQFAGSDVARDAGAGAA